MNRMTVGELIDELSGYDRSQRVSVYFKGIDLTPYKIVEHADETEVAIYATPFIGDPGSHYSALALSMISRLDKPEHHLRPIEWSKAMAKSFNDKIGLPMVEVVTVDGYPRVGLIHGMAKILDEQASEAPGAFSLAEARKDSHAPKPIKSPVLAGTFNYPPAGVGRDTEGNVYMHDGKGEQLDGNDQ